MLKCHSIERDGYRKLSGWMVNVKLHKIKPITGNRTAKRRRRITETAVQHIIPSEKPSIGKLLDLGSIPGATMLDRSFILAAIAIHLITVVPACLLGLT